MVLADEASERAVLLGKVFHAASRTRQLSVVVVPLNISLPVPLWETSRSFKSRIDAKLRPARKKRRPLQRTMPRTKTPWVHRRVHTRMRGMHLFKGRNFSMFSLRAPELGALGGKALDG